MSATSPDWVSLQFVCTHEVDRWPVPDRDTEELHRQAVATYKDGSRRNDAATLREAFDISLKAALRGHVKAMNNTLIAYRDGDGVGQSDTHAVNWAERLIERDLGLGYYHMGTFLEQGIGVRPDRAKALAYFRKAADRGNAQGQLATGRALIDAFHQHPDRDRGYALGEQLMTCALEQGLAEAGYELGMHLRYARDSKIDSLTRFQAAAKLGHRQSLFMLMRFFSQEGAPAPGLQTDAAKAGCYEKFWRETEAEPGKAFPDLDRVCPLPAVSPRSRG